MFLHVFVHASIVVHLFVQPSVHLSVPTSNRPSFHLFVCFYFAAISQEYIKLETEDVEIPQFTQEDIPIVTEQPR